MNFILQTTRKKSLLALILGIYLFSTQTAFSQHRTWDGGAGTSTWSDAANWSGDVVPTTTDSVTIIAGANVIVTSTTTILKLRVLGATGSQGKVTINLGVTLTVNSTSSTSPTGANNGAVMLFGGIIDNSGVLYISGKQGLDALRFDNPTSGTVSSTYMGSGALTCDTQNGTGGGGSANTGAGINFSQTSGTATFTLSSTATYNFFIFVTSGTGGTKSAIYCPKGTAKIDGTGTITVTGGKRSIRVIPNAINEAPNLTIESGVTMNLSTTITTASIGMVLLDAGTFAGISVNMTNKGILNFSGDANHPIYMNNQATATNTINFTNEGTININGTFADATASATTGGINMAGGVNASGHGNIFTNSGAINFNTTSGGTSTKPLFICSISPINVANNSGTITVGTFGAPVTAIRLGDGETTFNNTGTIEINAGNILGFTSTGDAKFNNNAGGILNFKLAVATTAVSNNVVFTNAGGTLKGSGTFTNTASNLFTSGTIAPGQSPGKIILSGATLTLNGTYNAEIDGTAGAGVTGGNDQIEAGTAAATVNVGSLTIATTFAMGYTPTNGDIIVLINTTGGTVSGTPTFSPALPANWTSSTTGGN